jgi:hypothetical protein
MNAVPPIDLPQLRPQQTPPRGYFAVMAERPQGADPAQKE